MEAGRRVQSWKACAAAAAAILLSCVDLPACPFCNPNITLTERIDQSHVCYAVEWVAAREGDPDRRDPGQASVRLLHLFKTAEPTRRVGDALTLPSFSPGEPGSRFLLFGHLGEGGAVLWDGLLACSPQLFDYLVRRPPQGQPPLQRLPYFVPFLEHPDEEIAVDAYSEFAAAPYDVVKSIAPQFPRDKLVRWVSEPAEGTGRIARIGFYGLILGLCGGEAEAAALERVILTPGEDFRIGIDGLMAGYLLLRGEAGLPVLQRHALSESSPSSEIYALQQAVRFCWDFGAGNIPRESLRAAIRPLLHDPQMAELALTDLTRWEDLTLVDRAIGLYSHPDFSNEPTQTAIARYYLVTAALDPAGRPAAEQSAIQQAGVHLAELQQRDPELVQHAERFLRPPEAARSETDPQAAAPPALAVASPAAEAGASSPPLRGLGGRLALWAAGIFSIGLILRRLWRIRMQDV